jgi:probable F420-dependent oxidoreductase
MHKGVFFFPTDYAIEVPDLAKELEDRGFESLFLCEHTHIPTSRKSPFPGGGELPQHYIRTHDPFVALSFAAAATKKLMLGTGICLVIQRDPIITANTIASLDILSGGRFIFGAGGGWNLEEMENHGTDPKTRFKLMRERLLAMKAMWTEEEASFHGDYVNVESSWCYPKPLQKPHPPIILGGETVHTLRRIVEFCDGWLPRAGPAGAPAETMAKLKAVADEAGRDMSTLSTTIFRPQPDAALLDEYAEAGATRVLLEMPSVGRDDALKKLDEYAGLLN